MKPINSVNQITCCYKCPNRTLYCHDTCTVYKEQSTQHKKCRQALNKDAQKQRRIVFASHRVDVYNMY